MAKTPELPPPSGKAAAEGGRMKWFVTLILLTLLSVGTGGAFGVIMVSGIEKRIEEKYKAASESKPVASAYSGNLAVKKLAPVVTNMASSDNDWVRLEASIIYKPSNDLNPEVVATEMRQDLVAYLRTLSVAQIQGASGLLHLKEDLNERAQLRSKGVVQELVVETLVVQ